VLLEAVKNFQDKAAVQDYSFATHSTVFKRIDAAYSFVTNLIGQESGAFDVEKTVVTTPSDGTALDGPPTIFTNRVFWRSTCNDTSSRVIHLVHLPKIGVDCCLTYALDLCIQNCPNMYVINMFDGSVHEIALSTQTTHQQFVDQTAFFRDFVKQRLDDSDFVRTVGKASWTIS
jgi:hypothetical protein